ncbi:tRNA lysidine(34) synthetase TilS [Psychroflexus tropicus]|uniref:tRNA lysidine(34) synthetase TilS n=1 Tax=Psychroflexus tropicus TaxID=197345 RepID=UPI00037CB1F3|nr:tRNA lysidine(34) synthetase TilS [Psychroflexus tropicus]
MQDIFHKHIEVEFPELLESPFIIAISGGVDSVVLAHLCSNLKLNFALAHCNFKLRAGDSKEDAKFVTKLAENLNCELFKKDFETEAIAEQRKESIQITARHLRYQWFEELIKTTSYKFLLTAHHLNDSLETFIINLSRSTGIKGLTGVPSQNQYIRRPLLKFSKKEIEDFAIENHIEWREDQSNTSTKYLRNQIRHQIVPELMGLTPNFLNNFDSSLQKIKDAESLLEDYTNLLFKALIKEKEDHYEIDIEKLKQYPNQRAILYQLLESFGFKEWNDVYNLMDAQTGKHVESPTHTLFKNRNQLVLSANSTQEFQSIDIDEDQSEVQLNGNKLKFSKVDKLGELDSNLAYFDYAKLKFPLSLRSVNKGDFFYPFGMKGKKKLSDFLKDEKVSPHKKSNQLVLCNGNDDIIWVLSLRTDNRYKVDQATDKILKIEYLK